jgi:hypothetical protein
MAINLGRAQPEQLRRRPKGWACVRKRWGRSEVRDFEECLIGRSWGRLGLRYQSGIGQGRDNARRQQIRALRNKANSSQDPEMPSPMSKGLTPTAPPWSAAGLGALIVFPFESIFLAEKSSGSSPSFAGR